MSLPRPISICPVGGASLSVQGGQLANFFAAVAWHTRGQTHSDSDRHPPWGLHQTDGRICDNTDLVNSVIDLP